MSEKYQPAARWAETLFSKLRMGRRIPPEQLPPCATGEGMVTIDRHRHEDRRQPIGHKGIQSNNTASLPAYPTHPTHGPF